MRLCKRREWRTIAKLDFDSERIPSGFMERLKFVFLVCLPHTEDWCEAAPLFRMRRMRSHGGGWHVVLESDRLTLGPREMVALQAILGSDWRREAFNLMRAVHVHLAPAAWRKTDRWNTLYSWKDVPAGQPERENV